MNFTSFKPLLFGTVGRGPLMWAVWAEAGDAAKRARAPATPEAVRLRKALAA